MKLALWMDAKARAARTVPQALALLNSIPGGPNIQVPLRYDGELKAKIDAAYPTGILNALIDKAPIRSVPIDSLVTVTQHTVNRDRVAQHLKNFGLVGKGQRHEDHGGIVDVPIVIAFQGQHALWDGNHRTMAETLLGGRRIKARYVDLPAA
jgi:hypothetical protein